MKNHNLDGKFCVKTAFIVWILINLCHKGIPIMQLVKLHLFICYKSVSCGHPASKRSDVWWIMFWRDSSLWSSGCPASWLPAWDGWFGFPAKSALRWDSYITLSLLLSVTRRSRSGVRYSLSQSVNFSIDFTDVTLANEDFTDVTLVRLLMNMMTLITLMTIKILKISTSPVSMFCLN